VRAGGVAVVGGLWGGVSDGGGGGGRLVIGGIVTGERRETVD
jgi:hypothetical protein